MGYRNRNRRYRGWYSRDYKPSKYSVLAGLFGSAVSEIRKAFFDLDKDALDELLDDYGAIHGDSAEGYARKTFSNWKSGKTNLSGQTMERLIELVPPYLPPDQRFNILTKVLLKHKPSKPFRNIRINVKEPSAGFTELDSVLQSMQHEDVLAHLPKNVMEAASWLYDDDITAARSMLAKAEHMENDIIRSNARQEIALLKRTIQSGQVKSASYTVEMPAGKLSVVAFEPSKCFVATVCFSEDSPEVIELRRWRDITLSNSHIGRKFIVWYYKHGERISELVKPFKVVKSIIRLAIRIHLIVIKANFKGAYNG